jgi:hypothetical protein
VKPFATYRCFTVVAAIAAVIGNAAIVTAQPPQAPVEPLKFRRIYAPADAVADWPRGVDRYLPVDASEFERLAKAARAPTGSGPSAPTARFGSAEFLGQLGDDNVLRGTGSLEIQKADSSETPLAPFSPCNLAIERVTGSNPRAEVSFVRAESGEALLRARAAGMIQFEWSLRGSVDNAGAVQFAVVLPPAPRHTLIFDLPEGLAMTSSAGLVSEQASQHEGLRTWRTELGGIATASIRIVPRDSLAAKGPSAYVRTSTSYELSSRGIDIVAQFKLDLQQETMRQLELEMDPSVRLVGARVGDVSCRWRLVEADDSTRRVTVELPDAIRGTQRTVRLSALAPLTTDRVFALPRITPSGVAWQDGAITLLVPSSFVLKSLTPEGCRQSKVRPLTTPLVGESIEMQCYSPQATARLMVSRQTERPRVAMGTAITASDTRCEGRIVADFELLAGDRFNLYAKVAKGWTVDAVETVPSHALGDWQVRSSENDGSRLSLRLSKALSAEHPLRVVVAAHGPALRRSRLNSEETQVVTFEDATTITDLLALDATGAQRFQIHGIDELLLSDPQRLTASQRTLTGSVPADVICDRSRVDTRWHATLEPHRAEFTCQQRLDLTVNDAAIVERYVVRVSPQSSPIDRLRIHFTQPRVEAMQWRIPGRSIPITATRVETKPDDGESPSVGETWDIVLPEPFARPFDLHADRVSVRQDKTPASLLVVDGALEQHGELLVRSRSTEVVIEAGGLVESWPDRRQGGMDADVVAAFRYEPLREAVRPSSEAASISISVGRAKQDGAIVWRADIGSQYEASGRGTHWARFQVHNRSLQRIGLRIPADARLTGLWVDGQAVELRDGNVPLVAGRALTQIVAEVVTRDAPFDTTARRTIPAIELDAPVFDEYRTCWLPAGYNLWRDSTGTRPTLATRLFGFLGRRAPEPAFDPLASASWMSLVNYRPDRARAAARVEAFLDRLGALLATPAQASPRMTWGELAAKAEREALDDDLVLLVDRASLADIGIAGAVSVPSLPAESAETANLDRSLALLWQAGLVLVTDREALVLTTTTMADFERRDLSPLSDSSAWWVEGRRLQKSLEDGAAASSNRYMRVAAWQREPSAIVEVDELARRIGPESLGWSGHRLSMADGVSQELWIIRQSTFDTWTYAALLASGALAFWIWPARPRWAVALCLLAAVVALAAPAGWTPLTSSALVGLLAGCALGQARRRFAPSPGPPSRDAVTVPVQEALRLGAVLMAVAAIGAAVACAQDDARPAGARRDFRVFIPSDDQGRPTGDRYSVPENLYSALVAASRSSVTGASDWSIVDADYRVTLVDDVAQLGLEVSELSATFELQVDRAGATVRLPIARQALASHEVFATLDGRPIATTWNEAGTSLACTAQTTGASRLQLSLRPTVAKLADGTGFDLAVPTLPTSSVEIAAPAEHQSVTVPSALGFSQWRSDRHWLQAALGDSRRLSVRWRDARGLAAAASEVEVDQWLWLKVRPGSVALDAKLNVKVPPGGNVRELRLAIDSRLRLLPPPAAVARTTETPTTGDGSSATRIFNLVLARPANESFTMPLSMLVTEATGVGSIWMPRFELLDVSVGRQYLGVTIDPTLAFESDSPADLMPVNVETFAAQWGAGVAAPQLAFDTSENSSVWRLDTQPRPPETTAEQSLIVTAAAASLAIEYEARLVTQSGYVFQYRLAVPRALEVERVSLLEDGAERAQHWAQDYEGILTVFLSDPVSGVQTLSLRGSMPLDNESRAALPLVHLRDMSMAKMSVLLLRQNSVLATVGKVAGLAEAANATTVEGHPEQGRMVAAWTVVDDAARAELKVADNTPQVHVQQTVTLARDEAGWRAEADLHWKVKSGVLDILRLEVPHEWRGPFQISPPATSEVIELPGQNRSYLVIYPRAPVRDDLELRIAGPLVTGQVETVKAPNIVPLDVDKSERFFRLPVQIGLQQATWETANLRRDRSGDSIAAEAPSSEFETFEAIGKQAVATLRSLHRSSAVPHCYLADVQVFVDENGDCRGSVMFDVELAEAATCAVRLPPGGTLLQAVVNDRMVSVVVGEDGVSKVPVVRTTLPQRIEIAFALHGAPRQRWQRSMPLAMPVLVNLDAERTLWTVHLSSRHGRGSFELAPSTTSVAQDIARLQSLAELAARPDDELSALAGGEIGRWHPAYTRRWLEVRERLKHDGFASEPAGQRSGMSTKVAALDRDWAESTSRLGLSPAAVSPGTSGSLALPFDRRYAGASRTLRCAVQGPLTSITIAMADPELRDVLARWSCVLAIVGGGIVLAMTRRRSKPWLDWLGRWPQLVLALAGIAWWLWLAPSVLGLVVLAIAVIGSFSSLWRAKRQGDEQPIRIVRQ